MSQNDSCDPGRLICPVPISSTADRIQLAHGEGGKLMRKLVRERIIALLGNSMLAAMNDAAVLPQVTGQLAITTDSFVVSPLFFPGGDIGSLAVFGTVNDLAVSGARPLYLTLALIIEEGFPLAQLDKVLMSVARAAEVTQVVVVAGDTKVVPRGEVDGLFINTTGVGVMHEPIPAGATALSVGDELLVTGPVGCHGIAVLCAREELAMQPPPISDCAPLVRTAQVLQQNLGANLKAMRDATRGGVAAVLHEWAEASSSTLSINEQAVPVTPAVRGVCELLGLDPLHVANEGTMVVAVANGFAEQALKALRQSQGSSQAALIGRVAARGVCPVTIVRTLGSPQPLDEPLGAPLPRIC
jgi:hydrogenase expression/formation protein HypE